LYDRAEPVNDFLFSHPSLSVEKDKEIIFGGIWDCYLPIFCGPNGGKTTISNVGILKRVFRKPPGAPGRVRVVDGQVG